MHLRGANVVSIRRIHNDFRACLVDFVVKLRIGSLNPLPHLSGPRASKFLCADAKVQVQGRLEEIYFDCVRTGLVPGLHVHTSLISTQDGSRALDNNIIHCNIKEVSYQYILFNFTGRRTNAQISGSSVQLPFLAFKLLAHLSRRRMYDHHCVR